MNQRFKCLLRPLTLAACVVGASSCIARASGPDTEWLKDLNYARARASTNTVPGLLQDFEYPHTGRVEHTQLIRYRAAFEALTSLGSSASNAVPRFRALLDDPQRGHDAAVALSYIGPAALSAFIDALTNRSPIARYNALTAVPELGPLPHTNSAPALFAVLNCLDDTNVVLTGGLNGTLNQQRLMDSVRRQAIEALARMGPTAASAAPALSRLLKDSDRNIRSAAAGALVKTAAPAVAAPPLIDLLSHPDPQARLLALQELYHMGVPSDAAPALNRLLQDSDANIRSWAATDLGKIGANQRP